MKKSGANKSYNDLGHCWNIVNFNFVGKFQIVFWLLDTIIEDRHRKHILPKQQKYSAL